MSNQEEDNFIGFNPVHWYGQVEDRDDPLKLGRVRVRIFGWHSLDKQEAPVKLLPWAQVLLPTNSPRSFSGPKVYDWVKGEFIDGAAGTMPLVTGIMPGINLNLSATPKGAPVPPKGIILEAEDTPSTPALARGVVTNSLIAKTNADIVHICDISPQIRQVVGWLRVKFGYVANLIREGIRTLLKALGLDPTGETSALVSYLKKIAAFVKRVNEILAEVIEWRNIILEVARIAKAIIDWILNLPERLAKLLKECLSNLYAAIAGGFKEILSIALGGGTGADKEIGKAVNEITSASNILIRQVSDLASTPQQIQAAFTNPSDPSALAAIDNYVTAQLANTSSYTTNTGSNRENLSGVV